MPFLKRKTWLISGLVNTFLERGSLSLKYNGMISVMDGLSWKTWERKIYRRRSSRKGIKSNSMKKSMTSCFVSRWMDPEISIRHGAVRRSDTIIS